MSERTFARRLAAEGLSFRAILDELRRDLAVGYLEETQLQISQIAWLLGFHQPSAFSHACRRWTGKSPMDFRRSHRPAASSIIATKTAAESAGQATANWHEWRDDGESVIARRWILRRRKVAVKPLEKAIEIALRAHSGQVDKAGAPYILHPLRMMLRMNGPTEMMAAVLHDVVEDGPGWTFDRLAEEGIPADVIEAVSCLTKRPDEEHDYEKFIRRASIHPVARRVKLADLEDNMDMRRIANPTDKDRARMEKYSRAHAFLSSLDGDGQDILARIGPSSIEPRPYMI